MQTFVPLTESYDDIAKVLDNKRLNKQALEGWQILMVLLELDPQGEEKPSGCQDVAWPRDGSVRLYPGNGQRVEATRVQFHYRRQSQADYDYGCKLGPHYWARCPATVGS
jgi:hypothetical protein